MKRWCCAALTPTSRRQTGTRAVRCSVDGGRASTDNPSACLKEARMAAIRGIAEIVIWSHDMEKSLDFYRDVVGLTPMWEPDIRGAVFLRAGPDVVSCPQHVVLVPLPDGAPDFPSDRSRRTMHHFGIEVAP